MNRNLTIRHLDIYDADVSLSVIFYHKYFQQYFTVLKINTFIPNQILK